MIGLLVALPELCEHQGFSRRAPSARLATGPAVDAPERPPFNFTLSEDCFSYAMLLRQWGFSLTVSRVVAEYDARFVRSFAGALIEIYIWDGRRALVPAGLVAYLETPGARPLKGYLPRSP